jgi:hypothetical protein
MRTDREPRERGASFLPGNPMNEIPLNYYYLYPLYGGDIETRLKQEQSYFLCFPENRKHI